MSENKFTLNLDRNDVGQIMDCLCVRRDDWRYTQRYFEEGFEEAGRIIEECTDGDEANNIADCYERIIGEIKGQL